MDADPRVDYSALHSCWECGDRLLLRTYPADGGWFLGTGCGCRDRTGLPLRYSTESAVYPSFHHVEEMRRELMGDQVWI